MKPTEQLWQIRAKNSWWPCELEFVGESWGWMAMVYRDERRFQGHRHLLKADAIRVGRRCGMTSKTIGFRSDDQKSAAVRRQRSSFHLRRFELRTQFMPIFVAAIA